MGLFDFFKKKKGYKNAVKGPSSRDDFLSTLEKQREEKDKRRAVLVAGQRPEAVDFGYSLNNPILTYTVACSDAYLGRLRTDDGSEFTWKRIGSYCVELHGLQNVMVDGYQLYLDGEPYKIIYICPYGDDFDFAPIGMKLQEKEDLLMKRPDGEIPPTTVASMIFSVDENKKKDLLSNLDDSTDTCIFRPDKAACTRK